VAGVIEYQEKSTLIHGLNPLTKMSWAFLILILSFIYTDFRYLMGVLMSVFLIAWLGGVFKEVVRLLKGLAIFAFILFALQILFFKSGTVILTLLPVGNGYLFITDQGIFFGLAMAFRMLAVIISFMVFLMTTRIQDLLNVLVEKVKVPYDVSFMVLMAIRFIPTFLNELNQISDAQKARAFFVNSWNPIKKIKAYIPISVPLVLLSLKKAKQMAVAMETRGYGAEKRTYFRELNLGLRDFVAMGMTLLALTAGIFFRVTGFGTI